ncbi:ATP synthase subunit I [Sorangium sp. So ce1335]|uniref:ATP synthase subunit I n=1 Tax=Sorangium sp. So ce1335 TaxID=3133335 RepID=UPI003F6143FB
MSADRRSGARGGEPPRREPDAEEPPGVGDATMRAVLRWVAGTAAVLSVAGLLAYGVRAALGVAIGGAIATANLYVFARIVDAFISRRGHTVSWTVIAMVKLGALMGGVWLILKSEAVSGVAMMVGYASLVVGISLGTLFGPKPPADAPPPRAPG